MKLRNPFARQQVIRTFEQLKNYHAAIIGYHEKIGHREGAGSLYQDIIASQTLCTLTGKDLACPPIQYLHHYKTAGDTLEVYLKKWAEVFAALDLHRHEKKYSARLPYFENPKAILDSLPEPLFRQGIEKLRRNYFQRELSGNRAINTVAIHLRNLNSEDEVRDQGGAAYGYFGQTFGRGLNPKCNLDRLLHFQKYILQEKARYFCGGKKIILQIISQGKLPGIRALEKKSKVEYFIDEHPVLSFRKMLKADLLVIAPSSFSYLACLLRTRPSWALKRFRHQLPWNCHICEIF